MPPKAHAHRTPSSDGAQRAPHHTNSPESQAIPQQGILRPNVQTPNDVLHLQRTIGNRAVGQLLSRTRHHQPIQKKSLIRRALKLTEVEQQGAADVQRQTTEVQGANTIIVKDLITNLSPGQITKGQFLEQLHQAVYRAGTEEYKGTNLTVEGCPYIKKWFERYQGKDGEHIEQAVRKYASAPASVRNATELIQAVVERARKGFKEQVRTGGITELPEDVAKQEGDGIVPEPEMIMEDTIQRGCLGHGGGAVAAPAPVTHRIKDTDNPNWIQVTNADILESSAMGDCWTIIMVDGANRLLAHLPSGDVTQLTGGAATLNNHYTPTTQLFLVMGKANQNESAFFMQHKQQLITNNCVFTYAQLNVIPGFWAQARVDGAGNVTGF